MGFERYLELFVEGGIVLTGLFEEGRVFFGRQVEELVEEGFDSLPAFGA